DLALERRGRQRGEDMRIAAAQGRLDPGVGAGPRLRDRSVDPDVRSLALRGRHDLCLVIRAMTESISYRAEIRTIRNDPSRLPTSRCGVPGAGAAAESKRHTSAGRITIRALACCPGPGASATFAECAERGPQFGAAVRNGQAGRVERPDRDIVSPFPVLE